MPIIDEKIKRKVDVFLDDPKITVNGKEVRYNNFEELKASPHYGLLKGILGMVGGRGQLKAIEAYIEEQDRIRNQ